MFLNRDKITFKQYKHLMPKSKVFGMISEYERAFLHYYAQQKYSGAGEIVDLGTWLGSITNSIAKGLSENKKIQNKNKRIFAYDLFLSDEYLTPYVMCYFYHNKIEKAKSVLSEYAKKFDLINSDLKDVKKLVYPNHD